MAFIAEKNVAIVWFAKSFLQLALTVDDNDIEQQSSNTNSVSDEQSKIFPIKMEQFQPLNEKQHFIVHTIQSKNHFNDAFLRIESLSRPGYFLDTVTDFKNNNQSITIYLSHKSQNTKKWQFINGQFRCNDGQSILIFDVNNTYSLKTVSITDFNKIKDIDENLINDTQISSTSISDLYEESIFHLCFYDGNSIPEQVPIFFYSPLYKKVITLITSSDLNNGGHWLRLEKYDPHMPTQSWIFNLTHQNDIRSSVEKEQVFDYYNDGHRYLLYTHLHHGRPNQQWDYINYKLKTHEADQLIVEYDKNLKELKMREDIEKKSRKPKHLINEEEDFEEDTRDPDSFDLSQCDIFGCSNVFLIFLANQNTLFDFSPDLDSSYLYNPLINQKYSLSNENNEKQLSWFSFDEFRGNISDNYQQTSDYENDYNIVTFKDNPNKSIKFRNVKANLNYRYNYYNHDSSRLDFTKIKNWKDFNCYLNDKISISSDQRLFIHDVQLSENCSVTFSLIMKGKLLSDFKKKPSFNIRNNNHYRSYDDYEDSFDIYSDEENPNPVFIDETNTLNNRYAFQQHRIRLPDNNEYNWQPRKPRYPDSMNDIQIPGNEQNANNNNVAVNAFLPFMPFGLRGRRGMRRIVVNQQNNNNNNNDNNQDEIDPNIEIKYFDFPARIEDDQFKQLLNGSQITITKENSEKCRIFGNQLGITGMVEVANFVDSFSSQFAHLSDLAEIQKELMEINESNYESLAIDFSNHIQNNDYSSICWIILSVSITKPLENDNLAKFCQHLLQNQPPEFKEEFKKSIIRDFRSIHTNLFFYRKIYLYCKDLFSEDEMKNLVKLRKSRNDEIIFFYKEFPEFQSNQVDQDELNIFVDTGFNSSKLQQLIRNDNIDEFQKVFISERMNPNKHLQQNNLLERIPLLNNSPTLIQYASFYGSVKIFKFLLLQQANLNSCDKAKRNAFTFALAGGNTEIIHIIQQELTKSKEFSVTTDLLRNAIKFGQNDVFKWLFSNTPEETINKLSKRDLILEAILSKNINALLDLIEFVFTSESICVHFSAIFDNCEFLKLLYPFYIDNKFSLVCDAAISGNVEILKFLLENNEEKFNNKINLDKSLKKVALRTAINNDNIDVFKYLANDKDYSYSNFIYACECNSLSFIKLFVENDSSFDISNILFGEIPMSLKLIEKKKQDVLDILIDSKYFNFNENFKNHSLFYYAVSNEIFDLARKIYNRQKGLYDINEENLLLQFSNKPEIVRFLISFPELNVNAKDDKFKSAIDNLIECQENKEKTALSISYLLNRPEIEFDSVSLFKFSINSNNFEIFEKAIHIVSRDKSNIKDNSAIKNFKSCLNEIVKGRKYDFFIKFIKSGLISIGEEKLIQYCLKLSSPKVYHEICNDKLPKEKEIVAIYYSISNNDYDCFSYLMSICSINFDSFNDFIPNSDQTYLTFAIKKTKDIKIVEQLLTNKLVDVNKPNKLGESPFYVSLTESDFSIQQMIMNHEEIKFTIKEFEVAFNSKNNKVFEFIIKHLKLFVDDPQKIVQLIIDNKSFENLNNLLNINEGGDTNQTISLLPILLVYSVKYNLKSFFKNQNLENKINKIDPNTDDPNKKGATALCYAIYQRGIYFFDKLKYYHPLLLENNNYIDNENNITPFGNVRCYENANEIINLLNQKKIPIELMIKEICGLNIDGQTALYTSIIENNYILFEYLLNLTNEFNQKLKENKKEELIDALIYTKNKDGKNPFFAICMNKNWQLFINHLIDKMIELNKKDSSYFGKYNPLTAAILSRNLKLINILLSKGFTIDHYSFNQILKMNLYNPLGIRLLKSKPDFQFDLFMPLHLIKNDAIVEDLFAKKRINFNFHHHQNEDQFDDDYLLLSAIRNRNEKLALLILDNCSNDYENILFDWKDSYGKTSLHYAIEKSMTTIVYRLIDIFTKEAKKFEFFFIEDKNYETPIQFLFKSLNEEYIFYFYNHALTFLKSCNRIDQIKEIFNKTTIKNNVNYITSKNDEIDFFNVKDNEDEEEEDFNSNKKSQLKNTELKSNEPSQNHTKTIEETLLTFAISCNKVKFIKFILQNIPEIDPNMTNSSGFTPLQISISNLVIFETLIGLCTQNNRKDLDVNKNGIAFSILENQDSKTADFCLNLLLKCPNFDINQKKSIKLPTKSHQKEKEILLIDLFVKKINNFSLETQKEFLCSSKIDFNSNPEIIFKLIESQLEIPLFSVLKRISDDAIKNAKTDDDEKDTIATFTAKNYPFSNALNSLILDQRIDFIDSKNANGNSGIDILKEKGQNDTVELILSLKK